MIRLSAKSTPEEVGDGSVSAKQRQLTGVKRGRSLTLLASIVVVIMISLQSAWLVGNSDFASAEDNSEGILFMNSITTSTTHSCALENGTAYCWGDNRHGELGDGKYSTETDWDDDSRISPHPVKVVGEHKFSKIDIGGSNSCAIETSGELYCWGWNFYGALGVGRDDSDYAADGNTYVGGGFKMSSTPMRVSIPGTVQVTDISIGEYFACAITSTGSVWCWGENEYGKLGDGTEEDSNSPVRVEIPSSLTAISISAGEHKACAVLSDKNAYCWGSYSSFEPYRYYLEEVDYRVNPELVEVPGGRGVSSISAGGEHSCLTTIDGLVYCWGNGESGAIGDGAKVDRFTPTKALLPSNEFAISVEAGWWHTCALMESGKVYCWGVHPGADPSGTSSDYGNMHSMPYEIDTPGTLTALEISSEWRHSCAIFSDNNAYCWGYGGWGNLGSGGFESSDFPVQVGKFAESSSNLVYVLAWASLAIMILMAAFIPRIYPWEVMSKSSHNSSNGSDSNIIVVKCNRRYPFNYFNKSRFPALGVLEESFSDKAHVGWGVVEKTPRKFRFISAHLSQESAARGVIGFFDEKKAAAEAAEEAERKRRSEAVKKAAETRRKNREKRAKERAAQEEKRKNAEAKAKRKAAAKKAAETRRKNADAKAEQERKKIAFSRPMLQTRDVPNATLNRKEKAWKATSGGCSRCGRIRSEMGFYWDVYPEPMLVVICDGCASKEEFVHADGPVEIENADLGDDFLSSLR